MTGDQFDAQGEAHEALSTAVTSYGARVLSDPRILGNLVTDLLPDSPRERSLLVTAAEAGVAGELQQHVDQQHLGVETAVAMVARKLTDSRSIDLSASTWVTTEYAQALGYPAAHSAAPPAAQLGSDDDEVRSETLRRPRHSASSPPSQSPGVAPFPEPVPSPQPPPTVWSPASNAGGSSPTPWTPQGSNPQQPLQSPGAAPFPQPQAPAAGQAPAYQPTSTYQPSSPTQPPAGPQQPTTPGFPGAGGYQPPSNPYQASSSPQAAFQSPAAPQQPNPYQPGGPGGMTGPAWGGGGQPPGKSRKGLLFGGIGGGVVLIGVILAVVLSSSSTHSSSSSTTTPPATHAASSSAPAPTASASASASPTLPAGITQLTDMLPADIADADTECTPFTDLPFKTYGLVSALKCNDPGLPNGVVYGFQTDNASDYESTWKSFNSWWGIDTSSSTVDTTCPPTGTHKQGIIGWHSNTYPEREGQVLECQEVQVSGNSSQLQPTYVWSYPTEYTFIDAQAGAGGSYTALDKWWSDEAQ